MVCLSTYMLVVHSVGSLVLVTHRREERDVLLQPGHRGHLHPLRGLVRHILHLEQLNFTDIEMEGRV